MSISGVELCGRDLAVCFIATTGPVLHICSLLSMVTVAISVAAFWKCMPTHSIITVCCGICQWVIQLGHDGLTRVGVAMVEGGGLE